MAAAAEAQPQQAHTTGLGPPPLLELATRALVACRRCLGDVGFLEPGALRRIAAHCSRAELERIEDATLCGGAPEGSRRDLTWYTWHLWHRIYATRFTPPAPGEPLAPLPGEAPCDYEPPRGVTHAPADYRAMLAAAEAREAARRAAAAGRLKRSYRAEAASRQSHGVEFTAKLPPAKRARVPGSPAAAAASSHTLAGKPASKVLASLGLARKAGGAAPRAQAAPASGGVFSPAARAAAAAAAAKHAAMRQQQQQPSALACLARPKQQQQQQQQQQQPPPRGGLAQPAGASARGKQPPGGGARPPAPAVENVRHYSDGMHKLYVPNYFTLAVATVTLGLYIGIPHILLGLLAASWWWRPAAVALCVLLASLALPAGPLRVRRVLSSYLFLCWRRYFTFSYLFEHSLDCYQDYIIAQFPHGAFPLGALVGGSFMATEYPDYHCYALAAHSAFLVPIWRHVHAWLGTEVCTKTNFHALLARGVGGPLRRHSGGGGGGAGGGAGSAEQQQQQQQQQQPGVAARAVPQAHVRATVRATVHAAGEPASGGAAAACHLRPGAGARGSLELAAAGARAARLGVAGSIRSAFRKHHSLSDPESSDSDGERCCACAAASGSPVHGARRLSVGSDASSLAESSAGSCGSCGSHAPLAAAAAGAARAPKAAPPSARGGAGGGRWAVDPATGVRKTGVSVGLMVGGIAEMFMLRPDHERIKLRDRKGFVRVALEHGVPILPVYMFGASQVLDFGPPWLARLSRRMRASVGMIYGAWGLPVPRRRPIFMVTGRPLATGPALRKDAPGFDARVDELHAAFCAEMTRIYYDHRGKYGHGYEDRPLVIA
ncbi:DGAT2 [Scenedesmus sp. PABB004]|nr:DGAT2 [Scenedesmus sp. PABB004]